jgi:foldase protein PrsA
MVIRCVTTFNKEETEANKIRIAGQRRSEAFSEEYDAFAGNLTRELNKDLWSSIRLVSDDSVTTHTFFDIYNTYFGES